MIARARRHGGFVGGLHKRQVGRELCLAAHLRLALPVACIDGLDEVVEIRKGGGLSDTRDFFFDVVGKTIVKVVLENTFFIFSNLQSNSIKFNNILVELLTILHRKVVKLMFCISDRII